MVMMMGISAHRPELGSAEAVPIGHHYEQRVTLGESSASTAHRRDHALYLVWRQVFTPRLASLD